MDLAVNAAALLVQLVLTAPLLARLGLALALAIVPLMTGAAFLLLAVMPTLGILVAVQALRRALHYGLERPAREILFTVARREERYKTKSFVDTVVYRGGDAAGGWTHAAFAAMGTGAAAMPLAVLPLVLAWLLTIPWLVRRHRRLAQDLPEGRTSWSVDVATSSSSP
jgi:AAA family ATP:ADP antiporter